MATYNELVTRIEVATQALEADVITLNAFVLEIEGVVDGTLATILADVTEQANIATAAANVALNSESVSVQAASDTLDSLTTAQGLVNALLASAPFQEAPMNGSTYGRKDGNWVLIESGSGGGGTVVSVNGVLPDVGGNVTLSIPTKTSELTNDSNFLTSVPVGEAPTDGKQYARKDAGWSEVVSGGGSGGGYTNTNPVVKDATVSFSFKYNKPMYEALKAPVGSQKYTWLTTPTEDDNPESPEVQFWLAMQAGFTQDATTPLTQSPFEAIDVRCLSITRIESGVPTVLYEESVDNEYDPTTDFKWKIGTFYSALLLGNDAEAEELRSHMLTGRYALQIKEYFGTTLVDLGLTNDVKNKFGYLEVYENVSNRGGKREVSLTIFNAATPSQKVVYHYNNITHKWA